MTTYARWMGHNCNLLSGTPIGMLRAKEREAILPAYIIQSTFMKQDHFRCMFRFRTGAHWLAVEQRRWGPNRVARHLRTCAVCGSGQVEDEQHMVFECSCYQSLRDSVEFSELFHSVEARWWITNTHGSGSMTAFMFRHPKKVAGYIAACKQLRDACLQQQYSVDSEDSIEDTDSCSD